MSSNSEPGSNAREQVESILGGQPPAAGPASACDAGADELPEFLRAIDEPVVYGVNC